MNAFNITNETIHAWLVRYIQKHRMVESLEFIASQLKADADEGYAYTKAVEMQSVRLAWAEQMKLARQEQ